MSRVYRPLEEVLGYYDFGSEYFVYVDETYPHQFYTEFHERTHLNLGTSTSFGFFHQFLSYINKSSDIECLKEQARNLLSLSLQESLTVHEAAATYCEFAQAESNNYNGLSDMENNLPLEYRRWRQVFVDFFDIRIPPAARGMLAYRLAQCALNTTILVDYKMPTEEQFSSFPRYVKEIEKSPNRRLAVLLDGLRSSDQQASFRTFLETYHQRRDELARAYEGRDFASRKDSFRIQGELNKAFDRDLAALPQFPNALWEWSLEKHSTEAANDMVQDWLALARERGYRNQCKFHFRNTDADEVDELDGSQIIAHRPTPQPGLHQMLGVENFPAADKYCARLWPYELDEPFLLNNAPARYLRKGDLYARYFPFDVVDPYLFTHTSGLEGVGAVLGKPFAAVVIDGSGLHLVRERFEAGSENTICVVTWRNWREFQVLTQPGCVQQLCVLDESDPELVYFLLLDDRGLFHVLRDSRHSSAVFEDIRRQNPGASALNVRRNPRLLRFLQIAERERKFLLQ